MCVCGEVGGFTGSNNTECFLWQSVLLGGLSYAAVSSSQPRILDLCCRGSRSSDHICKVAHANMRLNCLSTIDVSLSGHDNAVCWCSIVPKVLSYASREFSGLLVGLANSEIHLYSDSQLVGRLKLHSPPAAMRFGRYGREEATLVVVTQQGGLHVRMLRRDAILQPKEKTSIKEALENLPGPRKLTLPKKGRQYVLQAVRERDEAELIYTKYQHDLSSLRFSIVKAYAEMAQAGAMPVSMTGAGEGGAETSRNIRLHGEVHVSI